MSKIKKISAIALVLCLVAALFAGCSTESKLKGSWRDSTGLVGYDFMDNNVCKVVLADANLFGKKITAAPEGQYIVSKSDDGVYSMKITYNVVGLNVESEYTFVLDGDTLTMTDTANNTSSTYIRTKNPVTTVASSEQTVQGETTTAA